MKKILALLLTLFCALVQASPWDLEINQYDQFGIGRISRLMPLPSGGQSGMVMYDSISNWPKIGTIDSTLTWSGTVLGVNPLTLSGKFNTPTGTTLQYIRGDGSLATFPTIPTIPTRVFAYTTRTLNTCFQISATRDALVSYSVDIATSLSLTAGQQGTVYLRTYTNSGCSTGVQEITRFVNGQTGTLTVGLALTQNVTGTLTGVVPAGTWVQLVTENNTGTPTFTARPGQEVQL